MAADLAIRRSEHEILARFRQFRKPRPGGRNPAWGVCPCSGDGPGLAAPGPEGPGLPARYSGARIGPVPPTPGIDAWVAHRAGRGALPGAAVVHPGLAQGAGRLAGSARARPALEVGL